MKKIGIITYDHPHLKTEQVSELLLVKKQIEFKFFALPFLPRKARKNIIHHRPNQSTGVHPELIAKKFNVPYQKCSSDTEIGSGFDIYIVLGSGILSAKCVQDKRILNCHPGIVPLVRGLDSFKWAICEGKPLGVTLHYIDQHVDSGEVVTVRLTNVYEGDDIQSLARRHYENEINLMANFLDVIHNPSNGFSCQEIGDVKKRMPPEVEIETLKEIEKYVGFWASQKFAGGF
jgi:phosphoribosylglycinamide formyltransferase-1